MNSTPSKSTPLRALVPSLEIPPPCKKILGQKKSIPASRSTFARPRGNRFSLCVRHFISVAALSGFLGVVAQAAEGPGLAADHMPRVLPRSPIEALGSFVLRPGFHAELVAAEPLISSPVAVAVDESGAAYVVEMRDYSEHRPEQLGRITRLTDTDGDGKYDHATVFLDHLPWPTAVTCWDGGVFLGSTPDILYAKDTNGDGVADIREVVFTGFASSYAPYATNQLNVQALLNSVQWGMDQRIQKTRDGRIENRFHLIITQAIYIIIFFNFSVPWLPCFMF